MAHNIALKEPAGIWVGHHDRGDIRAHGGFHRGQIHAAIIRRRNIFNHETALHRCCGLVPWADSGANTRRARLAPSPRASIAALIAIMPHSSPWAPAFGDMAHGGHVGQLLQPMGQLVQISSNAPCTVLCGASG